MSWDSFAQGVQRAADGFIRSIGSSERVLSSENRDSEKLPNTPDTKQDTHSPTKADALKLSGYRRKVRDSARGMVEAHDRSQMLEVSSKLKLGIEDIGGEKVPVVVLNGLLTPAESFLKDVQNNHFPSIMKGHLEGLRPPKTLPGLDEGVITYSPPDSEGHVIVETPFLGVPEFLRGPAWAFTKTAYGLHQNQALRDGWHAFLFKNFYSVFQEETHRGAQLVFDVSGMGTSHIKVHGIAVFRSPSTKKQQLYLHGLETLGHWTQHRRLEKNSGKRIVKHLAAMSLLHRAVLNGVTNSPSLRFYSHLGFAVSARTHFELDAGRQKKLLAGHFLRFSPKAASDGQRDVEVVSVNGNQEPVLLLAGAPVFEVGYRWSSQEPIHRMSERAFRENFDMGRFAIVPLPRDKPSGG